MEFHGQLIKYYENNQLSSASRLLMRELGSILAHNKKDFVELLNESTIPASTEMSDAELINLFVNNIDRNKKLMLGAALLANIHNKQMNADGESELNDDGVKVAYSVLQSNFVSDEDYANAGGGLAGAIAGAVQGVAGMGSKAIEGQQMKKHGAVMVAQRKEDAKAQMAASIMAKKQAELEVKKNKEKTTRTILIVGGVVVGVAIIGTIAYFALRKK